MIINIEKIHVNNFQDFKAKNPHKHLFDRK